jgi:hypothetical protein
MKNPLPALITFAAMLLGACSGNELVGIHVTLTKDGSGTVTTRSLIDPGTPGPVETQAQGATWTAHASLVASQGTFKNLGELRFGNTNGLRFAPSLGGEQPSLRVYVPRGPDAAWHKALVPALGGRRQMAKVYDPTGKTSEVGSMIRLEIEVPGEVVASNALPTGRGVEADRERKRAFLLLPASSVAEAGEELVWDITWR